MEAFVGFVVLVALLVYLFTRPKNKERFSSGDANEPRESSRRMGDPPSHAWRTRASHARPFNAKSAQKVREKRVIEGTAHVTDGDTITIQKTQIRLYGIDAPELDHPFGKKAKWAMVSLCKGQKVRAEITDEDDYGRKVAKCFLPDGRDLSAELVAQGLALDWSKYSGGKYRHLEVPGVRKKLWLADARQKGLMQVLEKFEASKKERTEAS